jgi:mgtE-like transporter
VADRDSKGRIVREAFPSEIVSIIGDICAGVILSVLILPFQSFILLILIIPALLSLRGNLSGPYIARTSRDFIIGEFNKSSFIENVLATYSLALVTGLIIGMISILLDYFLIRLFLIPLTSLLFIPIISISLTLSVSIPCSTMLNYLAFKNGMDPNNVVNPVMTAIDDFLTVICFFITLLILGVP